MASLKTAPPAPVIPPTRSLRAVTGAVAVARPKQWVKNGAVLLPFLDPRVWEHATLARPALAVAAFALASSLVYVVNDISDRYRDRHHPVKRHRPIASGAVTVRQAVLIALVCGAASAAIILATAPTLLVPIGAYVALNFAYSRHLRNVPVLELFIVAVGFPLRALCGYQALDTPPSSLIILSTLFMSLLLVLGKRRRELEVASAEHRAALRGYTAPLIDQLISITAGLATATFLLFALSGPHSTGEKGLLALLVVPLLVMALFRYLQRLAMRGGDGDPTRLLLRDPVLIAIAIACVTLIGAAAAFDGTSILFGPKE